MAVVNGFVEGRDNIVAVSSDMEVVPLYSGEPTGGTGGYTVDYIAREGDFPFRLKNDNIAFTYGDLVVSGEVSGVTHATRGVNLTVDTVLQRLNVVRRIPGSYKTKTALIQDLCASVGVSALCNIEDTTVQPFPGYHGTIWQYLKMFMQAHKIIAVLEKSARTGNAFKVLFMSAYQGMVNTNPGVQVVDWTRTLSDTELADRIAVNHYDLRLNNNEVPVYPVGPNSGAQIIQVQSGETVEIEVKLSAWMETLHQPVPLDALPNTFPVGLPASGAYTIAGNDGLPVKASEWTARGGRLTVELTDDPSVARVRVTAPAVDRLAAADGLTDRMAPYSIAETSGNLYNSLFLKGVGVSFHKATFEIHTGAKVEPSDTPGYTVDNPFLGNLSLAYDLGMRVAQTYAGINRVDNLVVRSYEEESLLGKRIKDGPVNLRIENANATGDTYTLSAKMDTRFGDFTPGPGYTFADFNATHAGQTFADFAVTPLEY